MLGIPLPHNKFLKVIPVLVALPFILYFLPFIIGGYLIYVMFRRVNNPLIKYSVIVAVLLPTLLFGTAWAVAFNESVTNPQPVSEEVLSATPTPTLHTPTPTPRQDLYTVIKVVDGDTLDVSINGKTERVRLIGVDTPETVDPRTPVQCFGVEASNKAKETLLNKKVSLEADSSQGDKDTYNRLLRYVFLEDGTLFNQAMIEQGFAYEYTYRTPYKYQAAFQQAEKTAREKKRGLWGDTCAATPSLTKAVPTPTKKPSTPVIREQQVIIPTLTPVPAYNSPSSSGTSGSTSGGDKDCGDFATHAEAQSFFIANGGPGSDPHRLDGDNDGVVCETLP